MPPPLTSPFRQITDWSGDPWATEEQRSAWEEARQAKWLRSLSKRDKLRIVEATGKVSPLLPCFALDDLDAPIRVGVILKEDERHFAGDRFKEVNGCVLKAWPK